MAVKTVTNANLAEYVAERQDKAAQAQAGTVATVDKTAPVTGVVGSGEETIASTPPPTDAKPTAQVKAEKAKADEADKSKTPETVPYSRFKEVNDRNKELDEFAQGEYEGRLTAQKRISELEAEVKRLKPVEKPKEEEVKPPDPKAFTVQAEYDAAVEKYQNAIIDRRVEAKLAARQAAERQQKLNELMEARAQEAAKEIPDFWDVVRRGPERPDPPPYIQVALQEWEEGVKVAYHLVKHEEEARRIYQMSPALAMRALNKLADQYAKQPPVDEPVAKSTVPPAGPVTTRAPAPVAPIKPSGEMVPQDLAGPMTFSDYRARRLADIRAKRQAGRK